MSDDVWIKLTRAELSELLAPKTALFAPTRDEVRRSVHDKLCEALGQKYSNHRLLADSFSDERGKIQDLIIGPIDSVTWIHTVQNAVRGNHYHKYTVQWCYLLSGSMLVVNGDETKVVEAGQMMVEEPGVPHAWKALEPTDCIVFTLGPRAGDQYESDTYRLDIPLIA